MPRDSNTEDPPYRVYRGGDNPPAQAPQERPYRTYRSAPRGLRARLRGEDDTDLSVADHQRPPTERRGRLRSPFRGPFSWRKGLLILVSAVAFWLLLSLLLFFISASQHAGGNLPAGAQSQLTGGGPMLTSANTVLVLGLDNRPTSGSGSKEPGANTNEKVANTDTIMLWRIGGGVSRRLSIPRDTLVNIPGLGQSKINAAWSYGGPALALKVIKQFTGLQINHLVVVDLANFPKFIDDVGGVTVTTPKICAKIAGGAANGGFTINLSKGSHHVNGETAELLARIRENDPCDPSISDLTREGMQQQILNSIKSQLLSFHTFLHLPWVAWDAPGVVQTDMGGLTMLQMAIAAEIGGSAPVSLLKESSQTLSSGAQVLVPNQGNVQAQVQKLLNG
jgi:LCP family protein required for cell wall assembly